MMRLWPDTLTGRALAVMLAGIVLSNGIGIAIFSGERFDLLTSARGHALAERVSAAARLMDETPPERRQMLVRHLRRPGLRMFWSPDPITQDETADWQTRLLRTALSDQLEDGEPDRLRLSVARKPGLRGRGGTGPGGMPMRGPSAAGSRHGPMEDPENAGRVLLGAYRLADGSWLNFASPLAAFRPFWMTRLFGAIVMSTLIVLAISIWAIRRAIQPLSMFAGAAERLGLDVNAPPLSESGPREVRRVSRAFNEMQRRLRSFVRDRTQMLAAISHDLRTPITRLRLRAELIEDAEQQEKMLADLDEIQSMIAATLAFARDDFAEERQRAIDLAVLLRSLCDEFQDVKSVVSFEGPAHARTEGRPAALKRAFSNLIENAVRYGAAGAVYLRVEEGACVVIVDDDGPGIADTERERVFEPFYRVEASRSRETGGVGLGLPTARSIIRGHGGDISLANRPEGGARATVFLPKPRFS